MTTRVWLCDVCKTQHGTEGEASLCEKEHPVKDSFSITSVGFKNLKGLYGPNRGMAKVVPDMVRIEGPSLSHGGATYRLDYVGFKGV